MYYWSTSGHHKNSLSNLKKQIHRGVRKTYSLQVLLEYLRAPQKFSVTGKSKPNLSRCPKNCPTRAQNPSHLGRAPRCGALFRLCSGTRGAPLPQRDVFHGPPRPVSWKAPRKRPVQNCDDGEDGMIHHRRESLGRPGGRK